MVGRVAGLSRLALADLDLCAQAAEALHDRGLSAGRHEHEQATLGRAGHDGRRQARVAAAGDGQRGGGIRQAEVLRHAQAEHDTHQVPRLVRAGDVARLVLDPEAALRAEAELPVQAGGSHHGRGPEAVAVHGSDGLVELAHERHEALVAPAARACTVPRVEARAVAHEGVGVRARVPVDGSRVQDASQNVVAVIAFDGCRAACRERLPDHLGAAAPTDQPARRLAGRPGQGHAATSALKPSIMASHCCTIWRVSAQKSELRRASNSSSGTPCCSTQV